MFYVTPAWVKHEFCCVFEVHIKHKFNCCKFTWPLLNMRFVVLYVSPACVKHELCCMFQLSSENEATVMRLEEQTKFLKEEICILERNQHQVIEL